MCTSIDCGLPTRAGVRAPRARDTDTDRPRRFPADVTSCPNVELPLESSWPSTDRDLDLDVFTHTGVYSQRVMDNNTQIHEIMTNC